MTQDFILGQLRLAMVAVLAYAGGKGWLTPADSTLALALGTSLAPVLAPWIWSIVANVGKKHVPQDSVAISKDALTPDSLKNPLKDTFVQVMPGVTKVVGVLLLGLLLFAPRAEAQTNLLPRSTRLTSFLDTIQKWVSSDIEAATSLATAIPDLQDPVGATCWKTFKGLGEIVQAHPLPVTLKLASDIEAARLIQMSIKKVCAEPACNQVWNDMQNQVVALAPISVPFTLGSLCSKVL